MKKPERFAFAGGNDLRMIVAAFVRVGSSKAYLRRVLEGLFQPLTKGESRALDEMWAAAKAKGGGR